jgi:hypothetical protein
MRLTKNLKDAFILAVMGDVPKIDYVEKIKQTLEKAAIRYLPKEVGELLKKESTRGYVTVLHLNIYSIFTTPHGILRSKFSIGSILVHGKDVPGASASDRHPFITKHVFEELRKFVEEGNLQLAKRNQLEGKLRSITDSVTTCKSLAEALPELRKYLPQDTEYSPVNRTLPVVIHTMAQDLQEAGWLAQSA